MAVLDARESHSLFERLAKEGDVALEKSRWTTRVCGDDGQRVETTGSGWRRRAAGGDDGRIDGRAPASARRALANRHR